MLLPLCFSITFPRQTPTRTSIQKTKSLKSQMSGAAVARGHGVVAPTWFPLLVGAIHLLASCCNVVHPYTRCQENKPKQKKQQQLKGRVVDTLHIWVHFDVHLRHVVLPVLSGRRVSVALYVLKSWENWARMSSRDRSAAGFPVPDVAGSILCAPLSAEISPPEMQTLFGNDFQNLAYYNAVLQGSGEGLQSATQGVDGTPTNLPLWQVENLKEHVRSGHFQKSLHSQPHTIVDKKHT